MPNFTKTLKLEKPLRGEFYAIEKHNENSDKIDLAIEKITVPTIEHLKNMIELQVGDIVDIQGYYTAGDGAHHKRKIATDDDGSGVQLANGLWANIVHNGEVNVSWFGAKGDGVTDDVLPIQRSLDFVSILNGEGSKLKEECVVKLKGDFLVTKTIKMRSFSSLIGTVKDVSHSTEFMKNIGTSIIPKNVRGNVIESETFNVETGKLESPAYRDAGTIFDTGLFLTSKGIRIENICIVEEGTNLDNKPLWGISLEGANGASIRDVKIIGTRGGISITGSWSTDVVNVRTYVHIIGFYSKGCTQGEVKNFYFSGLSDKDRVFSEEQMTGMPSELTVPVGDGDDQHPFGGRVTSGIVLMWTSQSVFNCIVENAHNGLCNQSGIWPSYIKEIYIENVYYAFNTFGHFYAEVGQIHFYTKLIRNVNESWIKTIKMSQQNSFEIKGDDCLSEVVGKLNLEGFTRYDDGSLLSDKLSISNDCITNKTIIPTKKYSKSKSGYGGFSVSHATDESINGMPFVSLNIDSGDYISADNDGSYRIAAGTDGQLYFKYFNQPWRRLIIETFENTLDTPYYTAKMQQEGIYDDFITYMDEQYEYEQLQREVETKRQEAYQLALADNSELTYEEWLSGQPQLMTVVEPQPSQALLDFKKKYLG